MKTPDKVRFCRSADGTAVAFAISGNGPPVLRLAGLFTHLEFDRSSPVWRPWYSVLERERTLIRYDARGSGLSDVRDVQYSFEAYIHDVEAVIAASGFQKVALFGIGGPAALGIAYAALHPDRVSHLILYAPFTKGRLARAACTAEVDEIETVLKLMSFGLDGDDPSRRQMVVSQFLPDATADQLSAFGELLRIAATPRNTVDSLRAWYKSDVTAYLDKIRCPTLVFHPRGGFRVPLEEGRVVANSIPGAKLISLTTRNTYPPDGDPAWDQIAPEIEAFLPCRDRSPADNTERSTAPLTERERRIFDGVVQGLGNKQIAREMEISEKTVRNQLSVIFRKLSVTSRSKLIVWAHRGDDQGRRHPGKR
jgi:pimeloyl-ACP methyl ester carboxylesterase/DNA-binding CsgD family transcriptional regulator